MHVIKIMASKIIRDKIKGMNLGMLHALGVKVSKNGSDFDQYFILLYEKLQKLFPDQRPSVNSIVRQDCLIL